MLPHFEVFFYENDAEKKQVDGLGNLIVCLDVFPRQFHVFTPMDIIENKNGILMGTVQQLIEIIQGRDSSVIRIQKRQIDSGFCGEIIRQCMICIAFYDFDVG